MYHLKTGKEYLEAFRLSCEGYSKHQCNTWISKLNYVENDVFSILTEESREHFRREIKQGDILFFASIGEKFLHLSEQQRTMVEDLVDALIKNDPLTLEKTVDQKSEAA